MKKEEKKKWEKPRIGVIKLKEKILGYVPECGKEGPSGSVGNCRANWANNS